MLGFLTTIAGMLVFALMIGVVSDTIGARVDDLKRGSAKVRRRDPRWHPISLLPGLNKRTRAHARTGERKSCSAHFKVIVGRVRNSLCPLSLPLPVSTSPSLSPCLSFSLSLSLSLSLSVYL